MGHALLPVKLTIPTLMRRFLATLLIPATLWLAVSCQQAKPELGDKPANLVSEEKMAQILTQVHLNEARVSKYGLSSADSSSVIYNRLHLQTLKQFGVDTAAYTHSYIYYSARPDLLARIYEKVVDDLKEVQKKREKTATKKPAA